MDLIETARLMRDARQRGRAERQQEIIAIMEREISELDESIPNAHGGEFAKKFTANLIRGLIWEIQNKPTPGQVVK